MEDRWKSELDKKFEEDLKADKQKEREERLEIFCDSLPYRNEKFYNSYKLKKELEENRKKQKNESNYLKACDWSKKLLLSSLSELLKKQEEEILQENKELSKKLSKMKKEIELSKNGKKKELEEIKEEIELSKNGKKKKKVNYALKVKNINGKLDKLKKDKELHKIKWNKLKLRELELCEELNIKEPNKKEYIYNTKSKREQFDYKFSEKEIEKAEKRIKKVYAKRGIEMDCKF